MSVAPSRARRGQVAALALIATLSCISATCSLASTSAGGVSDRWQAEPFFLLNPHRVPGLTEGGTSAVYRLLDPQGNQIGSTIRRPRSNLIAVLEVPRVPGVYTVEGWLEDENGPLGPAGSELLRFDDAAPASPLPTSPSRWLLGSEPALLKIGHPSEPFPLSGIRGYAISLDKGGGSSPCANPACSVEETDLPGGVGDDSISLGTLPEGTTFVRVAAVSGSGVASATVTTEIKVDATRPTVSLQGVPTGWSNGPLRVTATAGDRLSGMAAAGAGGPFTAIALDGGAPIIAPGDRTAAWVAGSGIHRLEYYARDAAGNLSSGGPEGPPPAAASVRIDEEAPQLQFTRAQDPTDPERIEATVSDSLSGADPTRGSIRVRLAGTRAQFEELPTRVLGETLVARWDSDSHPPGKYEFLAIGFDLAGNLGHGTSRERGGQMVLVNPLKNPVVLTAGLAAGRRSTWEQRSRIQHGQLVRFGGRLRSLGGAALADAPVAITEVFAVGSGLHQRKTLVRTRSDGTFSLVLPPGPSREVAASFAGSKVLSRASSPGAILAVQAAIRLRASAPMARIGGAPIVFSGRVGQLGTETARGLPVELEYRYRGAGWRGFRTLEADARGRFRYAYRFSDDDSRGVRFQFRARVAGHEGWPYEPASSRPVSVTGR